jgi:PAS domain S-box-containing protein
MQGDSAYRELLEAAPDAIVIVGSDGRILLVNRQTERLFGYSREELVGQAIEMLLPERFRHGHGSMRAAYIAAPRVRPMASGLDLYGLRKDSTEFAAEISLSPVDSTEGRRIIATIRDVSERKKLEQLRRDRDEALKRTPGAPAPTHTGPRILKWRELELDQGNHRVGIAGVELVLRPLEFRLAATLLKSPGRSFTREELLQLVWGSKPDEKTRTVDTHVRRLRERLGAYGEAIETMHGVGYRWKPEEG